MWEKFSLKLVVNTGFFCDSYVRPEIFMGMKHGVTENMECCQIERERALF